MNFREKEILNMTLNKLMKLYDQHCIYNGIKTVETKQNTKQKEQYIDQIPWL